MYRHPHLLTSSSDLSLLAPFKLDIDDCKLSINKLKSEFNNYFVQHTELSKWKIIYELDEIYLNLDSASGIIEDQILNLMPFLNFCFTINIHLSACVPYMMSWGDYEYGTIYISTDSGDSEAIISGISCHGHVITHTIPWKY